MAYAHSTSPGILPGRDSPLRCATPQAKVHSTLVSVSISPQAFQGIHESGPVGDLARSVPTSSQCTTVCREQVGRCHVLEGTR
jgi:hypothetical protein